MELLAVIGHDSGKPGAWYEEGWVVLQLLRVLAEEIESVTWEARHEDGQGVDLWVAADGRREAIQCKTRSTGSWTLHALATGSRHGRSVVEYAKYQLDRDPDTSFHLVSDAPCQELGRILDAAGVIAEPDSWWAELKDRARVWFEEKWDLGGSGGPTVAHGLARRITVRVTSQAEVDDQIRRVAQLLAGSKGSALLHCLVELARKSLTLELRSPEIEAAVAAEGIRLEPRAREPWLRDRLVQLTAVPGFRIRGFRLSD